MPIYGRTQPLAQCAVLDALDALKQLGFDVVEVRLEAEDRRGFVSYADRHSQPSPAR